MQSACSLFINTIATKRIPPTLLFTFHRYAGASRSGLFSIATMVLLRSVSWAAEGVIYRTPDATGKYCHLRFPAIQEETLSWNRPVLKDPSEGDIIDFYCPCDAEILRQKEDARRWRDRIDSRE